MPLNLNLPPAALAQMAQPDERAPSSLSWPAWMAAFGDAGDLISTQLALHAGAHEANPLLPKGAVANGLVQGAEDLAMQYAIHRLSASHPALAKVLGVGVGAMGAYSTLRNLQTLRAQTR
jgi:hypothetical protein